MVRFTKAFSLFAFLISPFQLEKRSELALEQDLYVATNCKKILSSFLLRGILEISHRFR